MAAHRSNRHSNSPSKNAKEIEMIEMVGDEGEFMKEK